MTESKTNKNPNQNKTLGAVAHTYDFSTQEAKPSLDRNCVWSCLKSQTKKWPEKAIKAKPELDPQDLYGKKEPTFMR